MTATSDAGPELFLTDSSSNTRKENTKIMATKSKASTKRTKVKGIPKSKRELTGKDLKRIKGGLGTATGFIPGAGVISASISKDRQ